MKLLLVARHAEDGEQKEGGRRNSVFNLDQLTSCHEMEGRSIRMKFGHDGDYEFNFATEQLRASFFAAIFDVIRGKADFPFLSIDINRNGLVNW